MTDETQIYKVDPEWRRRLFVLLAFFAMLFLVTVFALTFLPPNPHRPGAHGMIWFSLFLQIVLLVLFTFVLVQKSKTRYEVTSEGIFYFTGADTPLFIKWDDLGPVQETTNGLTTLVDKEGKTKIPLLRLVSNFNQLKAQVRGRTGNRPAAESAGTEVFPMGGQVKTTYLVGGIFFLVFSLLCFGGIVGFNSGSPQWQTRDPVVSSITVGLIGAAFLVIALYCLWTGPRARQSKIEISSQGLARLEGDGSRVFIAWEEIGRLTQQRGQAYIFHFKLQTPIPVTIRALLSITCTIAVLLKPLPSL